MTEQTPVTRFIHALGYDALPPKVRTQAELCLLDLTGIGIGGAQTDASRIISAHANTQFGGNVPIFFDGRRASASGAALAMGMTIDALDGHDGFNPAKGHAGCGVFAGTMAMAQDLGISDGKEVLTAIVLGYEIACRVAMAQHATVPDYHTSGAWVAVAVAAIGARLMRLDADKTRHALGIAEYHGPRSQMMRCIDHPAMVKDGSGWGAMAGVSAGFLARDGFTGAPALTVEEAPDVWDDLGHRWLILEQYFKPYPVCRWAQAPVEGVLELRGAHGLVAADVARIEVETFHESVRLATREPATTDAAQYSTSFPCAVAMVRGAVGPADIADGMLRDPEVLRLSGSMVLREHDRANAAFPDTRLARITLELTDGRRLQSGWKTPRWDADAPPTETELREKFHVIAGEIIGVDAAASVEAAIAQLPGAGPGPLATLLSQPMRRATTSGSTA